MIYWNPYKNHYTLIIGLFAIKREKLLKKILVNANSVQITIFEYIIAKSPIIVFNNIYIKYWSDHLIKSI